ncbi:MAG: hypothetical protein JO123_08220 [Ktedonobacteraceae bacterium]|nr:hypothetical protein [Ktedonobacteraceae bacterium]
MTQQQPKNYLHKKGQQQHGPNTTRVFVRQMPDTTIHHPPGAMFFIGGLGILAGLAANVWQFITTFTAFWTMFNPRGTVIDPGKQPVLFVICGMMAFSFQFALMMLVFRLDTTWKKHHVTGQTAGIKEQAQAKVQQFKSTTVEIVQHVNLVVIWGALGFVVDTIGDYTFIAIYTTTLDPPTSTFIIFCYAVALYALSTVAFVRSIEYVWAGFAASDNLREQRQQTQQQSQH